LGKDVPIALLGIIFVFFIVLFILGIVIIKRANR
jgi:hypothetical protein